MKNIGATNQKAGEAFLAENAKKSGVVTLPSGLQYKILKAGQGAIPKDDSWVEANYRGTLLDGTEFDSSYRKGKPAVFQVKEATQGWREAMKLMPAGSKWQLFVPSALGYGERGAGREIGPNAALIFEVELLNANAGVGVPAAQGK
jgi:FKBP-type peptidyl-prolyl cis-trans isomerase FklB